MTTFGSAVGRLASDHRSSSESSARVLLTTVFGDALRPREQAISVQDLAGLVEPLGVNERLVRTSLQRMTTEGLVVAERIGRRSFYSVAADAAETFAHADQRFYRRRKVEWDGQWTIVVIDPGGPDTERRSRLARELRWLGMRALQPGVLVSPTVAPSVASDTADRLQTPIALAVRGHLDAGTLGVTHDLTSLDPPEAELHSMYERHLDDFTPLLRAAGSGVIDPDDAFVARTLLIDGWRRVALRSTDLPDALLPPGWRADEAYTLTADLYRKIRTPSEAHLDAVLGPSDGRSRAHDRFVDD